MHRGWSVKSPTPVTRMHYLLRMESVNVCLKVLLSLDICLYTDEMLNVQGISLINWICLGQGRSTAYHDTSLPLWLKMYFNILLYTEHIHCWALCHKMFLYSKFGRVILNIRTFYDTELNSEDIQYFQTFSFQYFVPPSL